MIEKDRSAPTVVNAGCLQELGIGLIELFQGFVLKARGETAASSPVVR